MFDRVLIANRGEIAVRVIRTLRQLGIESVAVYSDADAAAPHVRLADRAVRIGPSPANESYLRVDRIIDAAVSSGANALHPGYGFLSENAELAEACATAGVVFIGPPRSAIEAMGDKIRAKQTVARAGVRIVPGSEGVGLSDDELAEAARLVGLPVLIKPSAGGGGKGMRLVSDASELGAAIASARREARSSFGDDTLLVERFIERPRHIEIQVFADSHGNVLHLGERECSLQRRHQKIIEEAPSPLLTPAQRAAMGAQAVEAARACGYVNAGTVEFIVSGTDPDHAYFMEMNTRLQVEHPVTEMVWGLDLVEWQLRIAAGERLPFAQDDLAPRGHAMEARVYAEDPHQEFLPTGGRILVLDEAKGEGVRVDSGLAPGVEITSFYDPMLAKVIAWGPDRSTSRRRLDAALGSTTILGVVTNIAFLRRLLTHPDVAAGEIDTGLVERELTGLVAQEVPTEILVASVLAEVVPRHPATDAWATHTGWRIGDPARLEGNGIEVVRGGERWNVRVQEGEEVALGVRWDADDLVVGDLRVRVARSGPDLWCGAKGSVWRFTDPAPSQRAGAHRGGAGTVGSPMPGSVVAVIASVGEHVTHGQPLVVVEAMKMEHTVVAPIDGVVEEVLVAVGDRVALNQPLVVVSDEDKEES